MQEKVKTISEVFLFCNMSTSEKGLTLAVFTLHFVSKVLTECDHVYISKLTQVGYS